MKGCLFITPQDAVYGFDMTGFNQVISAKERIIADLEEIVRHRPAGIVFVDERLLTEAVNSRIQVIEKQWQGAIVILPEPGTDIEAGREDFGMRLIARVLGYQIKLS